MCAPLTPETRGMVGAAELDRAKPSAGKERESTKRSSGYSCL